MSEENQDKDMELLRRATRIVDLVEEIETLQAERDELKNVVNALEKEVSAYADSLLEALRERDRLRGALEKAVQLCDICSDWNLDEVEIDEETISVRDVKVIFEKALEGREG